MRHDGEFTGFGYFGRGRGYAGDFVGGQGLALGWGRYTSNILKIHNGGK